MSKVLPMDRPWRIHLRRGMQDVQEGRYDRAVQAFEKAFDLGPDEPEVLVSLGRERFRQGLYEESEELLQAALKRNPESAIAAATLARLLGLHLDRRQEAFQILHQALRHNPNAAALHVIRGELLLEDGAYKDARAAFGQVLDHDAADEAARTGVARTYNIEGIKLSEQYEYEPAIFAFKRAADLDPNWSGPLVNLGVTFGRMGKLDKAIEAYSSALDRDPTNPVAYFNLGTAHHELGNYQAAVAMFEDLLSLAPDFPRVRAALANVLGELKEYDRTIALLLEELEIDNKSASSWASLGLAYICCGNTERGEECLKRALALDPGYLNAHYTLAMFYVTQKRLDEAEKTLVNVFRLNPRQTVKVFANAAHFDPVLEIENLNFLV
ncbi:MAG: tetratricopeptide repeat protein [Pseudomonadota bacterium]